MDTRFTTEYFSSSCKVVQIKGNDEKTEEVCLCFQRLGPISWFRFPTNSALAITIIRLLYKRGISVLALKRRMPRNMSMQACKQIVNVYPGNTLDISANFPATVSDNCLLTVSRAMKFDPDIRHYANIPQKVILLYFLLYSLLLPTFMSWMCLQFLAKFIRNYFFKWFS